ncbi:CHAT domain-containing protein, partial [bacterium]|nr:CHAT domain-containing protein [bacterium]
EAIDMYKKALVIIEKNLGSDNDDVARILSNIGIAFKDKGNYDQSLEYRGKALKIRSNVFGHESLQVGQTYAGIAVDYFLKEDYSSAIKYYEESLRIKKKFLRDDHPEIAAGYFNLGMVYNRIQNNELALSHYYNALYKYQKTYNGTHIDIAKSFDNIGRIFLEEGQPDSALNYYRKGLAIWTQLIGKSHYYMGFAYRNLGDVFLNKKKYEEALESYNRSLKVNLENFGLHHPQTAESYQRLGALYNEWGRKDLALKNYQLSLQSVCPAFKNENVLINPVLNRILDENILLRGLSEKAEIFSRSVETMESAGETYLVCADVIDLIKRNFKTEDSKIDYGEQVLKIYESGIAVNYHLYQRRHDTKYLFSAFRLIEKSKSYVLFEALADSKAKLFSGVPDSLLEYERKLKTNIANYQKRIYQEEQKGRQKDSTAIAKYAQRIFGFERQYDDYVDHLKDKYPGYYKIKFEPSLISVYSVQSAIDSETVVLDYFSGQNSLYMISVSKDTVQFRSLGLSMLIEDKTLKMKSAIASKNKKDYIELASDLYNLLLMPELTDTVKYKKLIVIPDGILNYLPFEALLTLPPSVDSNYSSLSYLVKKYQVSYGVSAGLLFDRVGKSIPIPSDGVGYSPVNF